MRSDYSVYQPAKLIQDIYAAPSAYYALPDVAVSPFTPIGEMSGAKAGEPVQVKVQTEKAVPKKTGF